MRVRRLDSSHDWTFGQGRANYADNSESVAQRVKTRLLSFQGDWFLDLEHGLPWLPGFERPVDLDAIEQMVKECILKTDGVTAILDFSMALDPATRALSISVTVRDTYDNEVMVNNGTID